MRGPTGTIRHCAALAVLSCIGSTAVLGDPRHPDHRPVAVCIQITVRDDMSGPTFTTLRDEANRIWLRHGVTLIWTRPAPVDCDILVPVLFDDALVRKTVGRKRNDALAVTVFSGRQRFIRVSAPRAYLMIASTRDGASQIGSRGDRDFRAGILLGRVVAHELGHALLQTTLHAETGLMRPIFGANDALSEADGATDLSAPDQARLATRFPFVPAGAEGAAAVVARR